MGDIFEGYPSGRQTNLSNLKCKVCENLFTSSGARVPRLLLCGHSLCQDCLLKLLTDGRTILCPFDRKSTYVPLGGVTELNKNFALLEVLESLQQQSGSTQGTNGPSSVAAGLNTSSSSDSSLDSSGLFNSNRVTRKCDENDVHVATLYCLTCATNLCVPCADTIHSSKTLSRHKRIPVCDAPCRQRPQCVLHPGHPVELVCLEPGCQLPSGTNQQSSQSVTSSSSHLPSQFQLQLPMMCYLCRDFSSHKGHRFNLLSSEADSIKSLLSNCLNIINNFSEDVTNYIRRLSSCMNAIEGTSTRSSNSNSAGSGVERDSGGGGLIGLNNASQLTNVRGTALAARQQVHDYFEDLRHNLRRQEEVALSVVNTFVREKKLALQQSMETLTMILSQLMSIESDLKRQSTLCDVDLITRRSDISRLVEAASYQQSQLQEILNCSSSNNNTANNNGSYSSSTASNLALASCDASIPVTFTRDNRVHIGPKIEMRLVMLGLNNAGKTSILFKLKQNEFVPTTLPTIGFNVETIEFKNLQFNIWDVGGDPKLRPLWKHYYLSTQALIFVVDSSDRRRLGEAQGELSRLMLEKDLRGAILLVLASKQDCRDAIGVEILTSELNLHKICCGRKWHIQACDAQTGVGLTDGLDWLSRQLVWAGVVDVCPHAPGSSGTSANSRSRHRNSDLIAIAESSAQAEGYVSPIESSTNETHASSTSGYRCLHQSSQQATGNNSSSFITADTPSHSLTAASNTPFYSSMSNTFGLQTASAFNRYNNSAEYDLEPQRIQQQRMPESESEYPALIGRSTANHVSDGLNNFFHT